MRSMQGAQFVFFVTLVSSVTFDACKTGGSGSATLDVGESSSLFSDLQGECAKEAFKATEAKSRSGDQNENGITLRRVSSFETLGLGPYSHLRQVYIFDISEEAGESTYLTVTDKGSCRVRGVYVVGQDSFGFSDNHINSCSDQASQAATKVATSGGHNPNGITIRKISDSSALNPKFQFNQVKVFLVDTSDESGTTRYMTLQKRDGCASIAALIISQDDDLVVPGAGSSLPSAPVTDAGQDACAKTVFAAVQKKAVHGDVNENGITLMATQNLDNLGLNFKLGQAKVYVFDVAEEAGNSTYVGIADRQNCQVKGVVEVAQDGSGFQDGQPNRCQAEAIKAVRSKAIHGTQNENGITIRGSQDLASLNQALNFNLAKTFVVDTAVEAGNSRFLAFMARANCKPLAVFEVSQDD